MLIVCSFPSYNGRMELSFKKMLAMDPLSTWFQREILDVAVSIYSYQVTAIHQLETLHLQGMYVLIAFPCLHILCSKQICCLCDADELYHNWCEVFLKPEVCTCGTIPHCSSQFICLVDLTWSMDGCWDLFNILSGSTFLLTLCVGMFM